MVWLSSGAPIWARTSIFSPTRAAWADMVLAGRAAVEISAFSAAAGRRGLRDSFAGRESGYRGRKGGGQ